MSLSSILSIARGALMTHQQAVDTASHNIANAGTPGYSRQRLDLQAATPLLAPNGTIGRGVTADGIRRARDGFLDASYRRESGQLGRFETTRQLLSGVEDALGGPNDNELSTALDSLLDAFSDLANDPGSATARTLVRENADALARAFHGTADRLATISQDIRQRIVGAVADVNSLASQLADLNVQITAASKGVAAPDLEDQRDKLIDQLSGIVDVTVVPRENGAVGIVAGGALLVDGAQHATLELRSLAGGGYGVGVQGVGAPLQAGAGSLRALSDLSGTTLPDLQRQLDSFARSVVTEVNALHRGGTTAAGATGMDFFDAQGATASSIAVAAPIRQSLGNIVTGATGAPGDGSVALRLAQLRTTAVGSTGGRTLGEFYTGVVTAVGSLGRAAEQGAASQDALVANVAAQRSSVSDVSIDEEMVSLIKSQQAFAAASKIVTAANEMMQSVLEMV